MSALSELTVWPMHIPNPRLLPPPDIREHALFATRHLLLGNPDNQAIIGKMDPLGIVDEQTGELRELPQRMGVNGSKNKS